MILHILVNNFGIMKARVSSIPCSIQLWANYLNVDTIFYQTLTKRFHWGGASSCFKVHLLIGDQPILAAYCNINACTNTESE